MLNIHLAGVRRNFGISSVYMYTASLVDETGERLFTLGLERHEALPLVAALHNLTLPRPQTINVMAATLKLHHLALAEVRIDKMTWLSSIYLLTTTLLWQNNDGNTSEQTVDLRPGDVLGLALLMDCPISLTDEMIRFCVTLAEGQTPELHAINVLLYSANMAVPEGKSVRLGYGKTPMRDALVKEFKAALLGKAPPFPEEDLEVRKKEYVTFLLG
ncbi:MAG: bifunctional nuclease domain-containing protein [Ktedonobacteraceae bacterium]